MARKESEPKRDCPEELDRLIQLLNALPRTDHETKEFLDLYHKAARHAFGKLREYGIRAYEAERPPSAKQYAIRERNTAAILGEFRSAFNKQQLLTVQKIGLHDGYLGIAWDLAALQIERGRLTTIINEFQKYQKNEKQGYYSGPTPIGGIDLEQEGPKIRATSDVMNLLWKDGIENGRKIIERLMICPECEAIKWVKKLGKTDTCGKSTCVRRNADRKRGKLAAKEKK